MIHKNGLILTHHFYTPMELLTNCCFINTTVPEKAIMENFTDFRNGGTRVAPEALCALDGGNGQGPSSRKQPDPDGSIPLEETLTNDIGPPNPPLEEGDQSRVEIFSERSEPHTLESTTNVGAADGSINRKRQRWLAQCKKWKATRRRRQKRKRRRRNKRRRMRTSVNTWSPAILNLEGDDDECVMSPEEEADCVSFPHLRRKKKRSRKVGVTKSIETQLRQKLSRCKPPPTLKRLILARRRWRKKQRKLVLDEKGIRAAKSWTKFQSDTTLETTNIIYAIFNDWNGRVYVGETGSSAVTRFKSHRDAARRNGRNKSDKYPFAFAMRKLGHENCGIFPLERCRGGKPARKKREIFWQKLLNSCYRKRGYNVSLDTGHHAARAERVYGLEQSTRTVNRQQQQPTRQGVPPDQAPPQMGVTSEIEIREGDGDGSSDRQPNDDSDDSNEEEVRNNPIDNGDSCSEEDDEADQESQNDQEDQNGDNGNPPRIEGRRTGIRRFGSRNYKRRMQYLVNGFRSWSKDTREYHINKLTHRNAVRLLQWAHSEAGITFQSVIKKEREWDRVRRYLRNKIMAYVYQHHTLGKKKKIRRRLLISRFVCSGSEKAKLEAIIGDDDVWNLIPKFARDLIGEKPIVGYSYCKILAEELFNQGKEMRQLTPQRFREIQDSECVCSRKTYKDLCDPALGHIVTNEYSEVLVRSARLRSLMQMGSKFRHGGDLPD